MVKLVVQLNLRRKILKMEAASKFCLTSHKKRWKRNVDFSRHRLNSPSIAERSVFQAFSMRFSKKSTEHLAQDTMINQRKILVNKCTKMHQSQNFGKYRARSTRKHWLSSKSRAKTPTIKPTKLVRKSKLLGSQKLQA